MEPHELNKLARSSRTSALVGVLGLLILVFAILYGSIRLADINEALVLKNEELSRKEARLDSLNTSLAETEAEYLALRNDLDSLSYLKERLYDELRKQNTRLAERAVTEATESIRSQQLPARIYLHILEEPQRRAAQAVTALLEAQGFVVPGTEKVLFMTDSVVGVYNHS